MNMYGVYVVCMYRHEYTWCVCTDMNIYGVYVVCMYRHEYTWCVCTDMNIYGVYVVCMYRHGPNIADARYSLHAYDFVSLNELHACMKYGV